MRCPAPSARPAMVIPASVPSQSESLRWAGPATVCGPISTSSAAPRSTARAMPAPAPSADSKSNGRLPSVPMTSVPAAAGGSPEPPDNTAASDCGLTTSTAGMPSSGESSARRNPPDSQRALMASRRAEAGGAVAGSAGVGPTAGSTRMIRRRGLVPATTCSTPRTDPPSAESRRSMSGRAAPTIASRSTSARSSTSGSETPLFESPARRAARATMSIAAHRTVRGLATSMRAMMNGRITAGSQSSIHGRSQPIPMPRVSMPRMPMPRIPRTHMPSTAISPGIMVTRSAGVTRAAAR